MPCCYVLLLESNGLHQAKVRLVQKGDLDQEVTTIQQVFGV